MEETQSVILHQGYYQYYRPHINSSYNFSSKAKTLTPSMNTESISQEAINTWRDYVLKQIVGNLETNKEKIIEQFENENSHGITSNEIHEFGLLDFDISITLHRDKKKSFGLGFGFFKANILR
jgi:hypothetical protein